MSTFSHCTAEQKCDEHFGLHWQTQRPVAWVLDLAKAALRFRLLSARSTEDWRQVCNNAQMLQGLLNAQWRDCVRKQGVLRKPDASRASAITITTAAADYADLFGED
jgi:hypothetical protein